MVSNEATRRLINIVTQKSEGSSISFPPCTSYGAHVLTIPLLIFHLLKQLKIIWCQVFDETADSNVSHVSGSSEMDHIREMKESQVAVVMQEQAKEPAPSQQPPPHTNGGSNNHEVGGGGGGPQPQVNTRLRPWSHF